MDCAVRTRSGCFEKCGGSMDLPMAWMRKFTISMGLSRAP